MLVTPSGVVMLVRLLQPSNAEFPMLVTPSGNTIALSRGYPEKLFAGMVGTSIAAAKETS